YHHLLYFAKWFVLISAAIDLITLFTHDLTQARIADQCFATCKIILLAGSVFLHEKKLGLWLFCAYLLTELGYFYLVVFLSGNVAGMFDQQISSYTIGTLVILIPTLLYYSRRQELLK
ncbi:MAG: hypothetical protein Q4C20_14295, partial [Erysipelotrichaceae bacterium]|nr:hypothetical protein [Erysipelotrichaceae bacterium]